MSIPSCNPGITMRSDLPAIMFGLIALASSMCAFALSTDRSQPMDVKANYLKTDENRTTNPDVSVTYLKGNVQITQGSIKAHSDEATIYQDNSGKSGATANTSAPSEKNSRIQRVLLIGKQAHLEQLHDDDCGLMSADADRIDYHVATDIADMTGHVTVVQKGKGEFHGEHMVYNTSTGEMQSGDNAPSSRVSMRFEPKNQTPAAPSSGNCGYPAGTAAAVKKAKNVPAANADDNRADGKH
jgi:lipopolysaccharide export system protein LptA